jgi:hypothetical protein
VDDIEIPSAKLKACIILFAAVLSFTSVAAAASPAGCNLGLESCTDGNPKLFFRGPDYYPFYMDPDASNANSTIKEFPAGQYTETGSLADADGDGDLDVITMDSIFYDKFGNTIDVGFTGRFHGPIVDFDGDSDLEIIHGYYDGNTVQLRYTELDGSQEQISNTDIRDIGGAGDIDSDGEIEVAYTDNTNSEEIVFRDYSGEVTRTGVTGPYTLSGMGDWDGDGTLDLVYRGSCTWNGGSNSAPCMKYTDNNGDVSRLGTGSELTQVGTVVGPVDIDGDNTLEILFIDNDDSGELKIVDQNEDVTQTGVTFVNVIQQGIGLFDAETNSAPSFNSTSLDPVNPAAGENISLNAVVYDADGSIQYTNLSLSGQCQVTDLKRSSTTTPSWNSVCTPSSSGWVNATFETVDDEGAVTEKTLNTSIDPDDTTAPNVTVHDLFETTIIQSEVDLKVSANESITDWSYSLNSGSNTSFNPNTTITGLPDQLHTLRVYAEDQSGNTGSATVSFRVETDLQDFSCGLGPYDGCSGDLKIPYVDTNSNLKYVNSSGDVFDLGVQASSVGGIEDFDSDGDFDIVYTDSSDSNLSFIDPTEEVTDLGVTADEVGGLADFNGDGDLEVVVERNNGLKLVDNSGNLENISFGITTALLGGSGDFDEDGDIDTSLRSTNPNRLQVIDTGGNSILYSNGIPPGPIVDFNSDGDSEVLHSDGTTSNNARISDADGNQEDLGFTVDAYGGAADLDNDSDVDVAYIDDSNNLKYTGYDGSTVDLGVQASDVGGIGAFGSKLNTAPDITGQELFWTGIGGTSSTKIKYSLNDRESNIAELVNPLPSGTLSLFNNTTAVIDSPGTGFDYTAEFEDIPGEVGTGQTDYTLTNVFSGYVEHPNGSVNTNSQAVNLTVKIQIDGDPMAYNLFAKPPPVNFATVHNGTITSSTSFSGTNTTYWRFKTDHVNVETFPEQEDPSKTDTLDTQYLYRAKQVSNNWSVDYTRLEVNDVSITGTCSNCNTRTVSLPGNSRKNLTYNSSSDFITGESESPYNELGENSSAAHTLTTQYTLWETRLTADNSRSSSFENVDISSRCERVTNTDVPSGTGVVVTENCSKVDQSGDFLTGFTEYTYGRYSDPDYNHTEDSQRIHNRTKAEISNSKSYRFSGVDTSGRCSQTSTADIPAGRSNFTTDCNRPVYTVDHINESVSTAYQDKTEVSNLSTQFVAKSKTLEEVGGYNWSNVTVSSPLIKGSCSNCGYRAVDITANASRKVIFNSSGDFLEDEEQSSPRVAPDQVTIGENFTAVRNYTVNNTVDISWNGVDISTNVSTPVSCGQPNKSAVDLPADSVEAKKVGFDCNPGSLSDIVVNSTEVNSTHTRYVYTSESLVVETDIISDTEVVIPLSKDGLTDISNKIDSTVEAEVDGIEKDTTWVEKFNNIEIVLGTNRTNSSIHEGKHNVTFEYVAQTSTSSGGGGSGGGGGGGSTTIIREVSDGNYSWQITSNDEFQLVGYPGRQFQYVVNVESTGDKRVPLNLTCGGNEDICDFVTISNTNFTLDRDGQKQVVISGTVPTNTSRDRFPIEFGIRFADPSFDAQESPNTGVAYVDFQINYDPFLGQLLELIFKFGESREISSPTGMGSAFAIPFILLPFLGAIFTFTFGEALDRVAAKTSHRNYVALAALAMFFILYIIL